MREDQLHEWLRTQRELQEKSYGFDFGEMTTTDRIEFITWNVLALTDELHEALAETGWKPWATSRHINDDAFKSELIDAFHFMGNLFLAADMDGDEVMRRYRKKRQVNADRQADGYDGVTTKCPVCKRALDDPAVSCTYDHVSHRAECAAA